MSASHAVKVNYDEAKSKITADLEIEGFEKHIITDEEISFFGFSDKVIKEAVQKHNEGYPDDVYLKSPTPWGDLYTTYDWPQVMRGLAPISAKVINHEQKVELLTTKTFANNSSKPVKFQGSITQEVEDSIATTWNNSHEITVGNEINFEVELIFTTITDTINLSYTGTWGEEKNQTKSVTLGTTSGVEIDLNPGEAVVATLTATRGTMELELVYEASVDGVVAVNYTNPYKGHHFYGFSILDLDLECKKQITQRIYVGFYSNAEVRVEDSKKGSVVRIAQPDLVKPIKLEKTIDGLKVRKE